MSQLSPSALSTCVREVVEFVDAAGWDQPPHLFALVPTAELAVVEPGLAGQLSDAELTPVAQDELPSGGHDGPGGGDGTGPALDTALATISWPPGVAGCALVQEIVILPPDAERELEQLGDEHSALDHAARHPERREARLVAGVLRTGESLCLLQMRPAGDAGRAELLEHPDLAPNLLDALRATFED